MAEAEPKPLTPLQHHVLREKGTEPAFTGEYWNVHEAGIYHCRGCGAELFTSEAKFDSGTGWPSFTAPLDPSRVKIIADHTHGMTREEVVCAHCGGHLGHRFPDGPRPAGQRYCMNSASLRLELEKT